MNQVKTIINSILMLLIIYLLTKLYIEPFFLINIITSIDSGTYKIFLVALYFILIFYVIMVREKRKYAIRCLVIGFVLLFGFPIWENTFYKPHYGKNRISKIMKLSEEKY